MMTLILAAAAAAQPATAPANPPAQPAPMMQMQMHQQQGHEQHGQMADMETCCCHDMMAKMQEQHSSAHEGHSGQ